MRVLLLEDNLMWSVRTRKGLEALGHEAVVVGRASELPSADLAIVNLGSRSFDPFGAVRELRALGVRTVGHAGHKENELWAKGEAAGCDRIVSNGALAKRLAAVLDGLPVECPSGEEDE